MLDPCHRAVSKSGAWLPLRRECSDGRARTAGMGSGSWAEAGIWVRMAQRSQAQPELMKSSSRRLWTVKAAALSRQGRPCSPSPVKALSVFSISA